MSPEVPEEGSWANRARAEAFGAVATAYDAYRPRYPEALLGQVLRGAPPSPPAAPGPVRVLDAATGTGILARQLAALGAAVTGAELDPGMAAVARASGLEVVEGRFEDLDLDRRFDRITLGQAWHWIEPEAGTATARRLLAPGGQLALLWNVGEPEPGVRAVLDEVYARAQVGAAAGGPVRRGVSRTAESRTEAWFGAMPGVTVTVLSETWRHVYPTAAWVALSFTWSDHLQLPPADRETLAAELTAALDAAGGEVAVDYATWAVVVAGLAPAT